MLNVATSVEVADKQGQSSKTSRIIHQRECALLEALTIECRPIGNASVQETDVNVFEILLGVDPFTAAVVDLEAKIRWDAIRLDGRKIRA